MAATFTCPACDAVYPIKPALIGRPVRCKTCKQVFKLGEDGIARLVEVPAAQPPPPPARPEPSTPPAAEPPARPATAGGRPQTDRDQRKKQVEAAVGGNLSAAAQQALAAVGGDEPERTDDGAGTAARDRKRPGTSQRRRGTGRSTAGSNRNKGAFEAVTTGEGSRAFRERVLTWALVLGLLAVIGAAAWLFTRRSPIEVALADYVAEVPVERIKPPLRHRTYHERSWTPHFFATGGNAVVVNLDQARLGARSRVDLEPLVRFLDEELSTRTDLESLAVYVRDGAADTAREIHAELPDPTDRAAFIRALDQARLDPLPYEAIPDRLAEAGIDDLGVLVFSGLVWLPDLRERVLASGAEALEIQVLSGDGGQILRRTGDTYTVDRERPYWGLLMRLVGGSVGEGPWRVLALDDRPFAPELIAGAADPLRQRADIAVAAAAALIAEEAERERLSPENIQARREEAQRPRDEDLPPEATDDGR